MLDFILLAIGVFILIKSADYLVEGASSIAKRFNVSDLVIGLTIVSFGTSAPELVVNVLSAATGNSELALGNIIGSNIANILLILGVSGSIMALKVKSSTVYKEIPFSALTILVLILLKISIFKGSDVSDQINWNEGLILLTFFGIFMYYIFSIAKSDPTYLDDLSDLKPVSTTKSTIFIIGGILGLTLGGKLIVDNAVTIATGLGISQSIIGLTLVAVGTSLPELATSVTAVLKKKDDIAVGNVVGSNIFNVFFILGLTSIVSPIKISSSNQVDLLLAFIASFALFIFMFIGNKHVLQRWQSVLFLIVYVGYTVSLFYR